MRLFLFLNLLMCPLVFIGTTFAPKAISFMEPVLCKEGMHLETRSHETTDEEGKPVTAWTTHCVSGGSSVDITWKTFLIMLGLPALGVLVFGLAPTTPLRKEKSNRIDPEAFE
jgi:hypothetical protein